MMLTTIDVPTLKAVKNSVIGNRTAKGSYGRDEIFIARCVFRYVTPVSRAPNATEPCGRLVDSVHDPPVPADAAASAAADLRIEAAHIIASLSYGAPPVRLPAPVPSPSKARPQAPPTPSGRSSGRTRRRRSSTP